MFWPALLIDVEKLVGTQQRLAQCIEGSLIRLGWHQVRPGKEIVLLFKVFFARSDLSIRRLAQQCDKIERFNLLRDGRIVTSHLDGTLCHLR